MTADRQGYLIVTLAKKSINRKLAKALMPRLPQLEMSEVTFKDLPPSNYDFDANDPPTRSSPVDKYSQGV